MTHDFFGRLYGSTALHDLVGTEARRHSHVVETREDFAAEAWARIAAASSESTTDFLDTEVHRAIAAAWAREKRHRDHMRDMLGAVRGAFLDVDGVYEGHG